MVTVTTPRLHILRVLFCFSRRLIVNDDDNAVVALQEVDDDDDDDDDDEVVYIVGNIVFEKEEEEEEEAGYLTFSPKAFRFEVGRLFNKLLLFGAMVEMYVQ